MKSEIILCKENVFLRTMSSYLQRVMSTCWDALGFLELPFWIVKPYKVVLPCTVHRSSFSYWDVSAGPKRPEQYITDIRPLVVLSLESWMD